MATPDLIETPGLSTSNTYASVIEATSYFDTVIYRSNWEDASPDERKRALLMATRILDEQMDWFGYKMTDDQALRWPQGSQVGPDGYAVDNEIIPQFLINATAEFAGYLIGEDRTADPDTLGFSRIKAGDLEMVVAKNDRPGILPSSVWQMLVPYGKQRSDFDSTLLRV